MCFKKLDVVLVLPDILAEQCLHLAFILPSWPSAGVEINARPLARGEWKSRGMSRIFAQVVRRASGYLNLFCQLYVPMNDSNYWNLSGMTVKSITNNQHNLVDLITVCKLYYYNRTRRVPNERTLATRVASASQTWQLPST